MSKETRYFHELPIKEMIQYHDFTFCMSDDNRYYEKGRQELKEINDKVKKEHGGWTKELVDHWNKYAPHDPNGMSWQKDYTK